MARHFQWQSADGQLLTLTDKVAGYRILAEGTTGLNAPEYRFTTDQYAGLDGVTVQSITADAREVVLGMMIQAPDRDAFRERVAALTRAMRPKAGIGTLIVTDELGRRRELGCYYRGGLEGNEQRGSKLPGRWWKATVHLYAPDPWWYGEAQEVQFGLGAPTVFFPIFPLTLSSSSVQGDFTVDLSDTDAPTYPVWTVFGPGTGLVLTNETTGRQTSLTMSLASGQSMTINTRPGSQSIRRQDGLNLMGALDSDPALWPLIEGVNQVSAVLTGASSGSRLIGNYSPRYAGV